MSSEIEMHRKYGERGGTTMAGRGTSMRDDHLTPGQMPVTNIKVPIKLSPSRAVAKVLAIVPCIVATCRRACLRAPESIETLVRVSDEGQAGGILVVSGLCSLCSVRSAVVVLVNLVNGEVLRIDIGLQLGLEWRTDAAQTIPRYTTEEGVLSDLAGTADASKTVIGIAD
jgi:hypothetical protein